MTGRKTVFIVTCGEYSDYHIEGVYDTLEAAQKAAGSPIRHRAGYDTPQIEEWMLGTVDTDSDRADARDGRIGVQLTDGLYRVSSIVSGHQVIGWSIIGFKERAYHFKAGEPDIWVEQSGNFVDVYAVDRDRGMKALCDHMAELKARAEDIA